MIDNFSETTKESEKYSKKLKKLKKHVECKNELEIPCKFVSMKNFSPPKRDYLRCKIIRSHKRAMRQIEIHAYPIKMIFFDKNNFKAEFLWQKFCQVYLTNKSTMQKISQTNLSYMKDSKKI